MLPLNLELFALFAGVMAVFAVTPGPAVLFTVATGVSEGPRAALLGVAGINAATLVWIAGALLGLGALVAAFPAAFRALAIAGGLYVGWLGLKALASSARGASAPIAASASVRGQAFCDGFAVQIANPKIIIFFTAILPPFVDPSLPAAPQLLALGATTIVMDVIAMSAYGLAGGALARALRAPRAQRAFSLSVGVLLLIAASLILLRT
ncbi:MAG: LysE family translocator [Hyphomonadaceae bacterium]